RRSGCFASARIGEPEREARRALAYAARVRGRKVRGRAALRAPDRREFPAVLGSLVRLERGAQSRSGHESVPVLEQARLALQPSPCVLRRAKSPWDLAQAGAIVWVSDLA